MSWLAERKSKNGKASTWLYRWSDIYGIEHQRSTKAKDKKSALRIQKYWDACLLANNKLPSENNSLEEQKSDNEILVQVERYLAHKSCELRESTIKRYRNHFDALLTFFKKININYLDQLSTSIMLDYKCSRLKDGISNKTVAEDLSVIRSLIRALIEEDILTSDPVKKWPVISKRIPKRPETLGPYSDDEVSRILEHAKEYEPHFYPIAMLAFYTGLRAGEIRDLKVKDIDFNFGVLTVFNQKSVRDTKTAYRKVLMPPALSAVLKAKCKLCLPGAYVFASEQHRWMKWATVDLMRACKTLGIQYRRFHGCRHTYATKAANSGIGLPKVQAALGHTNLATTQRYVKSNQMDAADLEKIKFG